MYGTCLVLQFYSVNNLYKFGVNAINPFALIGEKCAKPYEKTTKLL